MSCRTHQFRPPSRNRGLASRCRSALLTAVLFLLTVPWGAGYASAPSADEAAGVYFRSTASFLALKRQHRGGFDWSDNGCSVPYSLQLSVPALAFVARTFAAQCGQHDFAYRNFGGSLRLDPSPSRRRQVDRHFYRLLRARCAERDIVRRHAVLLCRFYARTFYMAVRAFGTLTRDVNAAGPWSVP